MPRKGYWVALADVSDPEATNYMLPRTLRRHPKNPEAPRIFYCFAR